MSKDTVHLIASLLFFLALILIVIGVNSDLPVLWYAGEAAVAAGMACALATRWVGEEAKENEEEEGEDGERGPRRAEIHVIPVAHDEMIALEKREKGEAEQEDAGEGEGRQRKERGGDEGSAVVVHRAAPRARAPDEPGEVGPGEHRARAHEYRAEAHRELAAAYEELARAEEERARAAEAGGEEDGRGRQEEEKGQEE